MKSDQQQDGPRPSNAFLQVMQTHDGGEVCNELAEAMREATQSVGLTGKAASIELRVKFTPAAKGAFGVVFSKPRVKKPEMERGSSIWFGDEHGNLFRENPRQATLPLRTVDDPQNQPARSVEGAVPAAVRTVNG